MQTVCSAKPDMISEERAGVRSWRISMAAWVHLTLGLC